MATLHLGLQYCLKVGKPKITLKSTLAVCLTYSCSHSFPGRSNPAHPSHGIELVFLWINPHYAWLKNLMASVPNHHCTLNWLPVHGGMSQIPPSLMNFAMNVMSVRQTTN
uniref:Uncharacterized protein n=1 Tax=Ditylenchus dipsaci TaxID=166011 RepID=A0A915D425_9BILA